MRPNFTVKYRPTQAVLFQEVLQGLKYPMPQIVCEINQRPAFGKTITGWSRVLAEILEITENLEGLFSDLNEAKLCCHVSANTGNFVAGGAIGPDGTRATNRRTIGSKTCISLDKYWFKSDFPKNWIIPRFDIIQKIFSTKIIKSLGKISNCSLIFATGQLVLADLLQKMQQDQTDPMPQIGGEFDLRPDNAEPNTSIASVKHLDFHYRFGLKFSSLKAKNQVDKNFKILGW